MDVRSLPTRARDVLQFWFDSEPHVVRDAWFRKDHAFDARIRDAFGDAVEQAIAGRFDDWSSSPHGALARVILLDQFTRNIFRDTPRAFAGDEQALATAIDAVDRGFDRELDRYERWFLYMPFEHSERADMQERSLALFGALSRESGDASALDWAQKHADIVRRFGRYPHRNAILGRESTAEEIAFLSQPGSRF
ncbi:MAG TPA: DUF924 family protein [Casimicrobiaceae bacterium]|nr:DUF924 family protein [Casimicrobiaceae bacterium]